MHLLCIVSSFHSGTDYIICNNSDKATLNFLPGSDAPQCFYICPVVDGIVELGGETLTVQVSSGVVGGECSGELTIPTGAMQTVQIDDSLGDGMCGACGGPFLALSGLPVSDA